MECIAENADDIFWKYKSEANGEFSRYPEYITMLPLQSNNSRLSRKISDARKNDVRSDLRDVIGGFYQCFATSNFTHEYQSVGPLIRLFFPGKLTTRLLYLCCLCLYWSSSDLYQRIIFRTRSGESVSRGQRKCIEPLWTLYGWQTLPYSLH